MINSNYNQPPLTDTEKLIANDKKLDERLATLERIVEVLMNQNGSQEPVVSAPPVTPLNIPPTQQPQSQNEQEVI